MSRAPADARRRGRAHAFSLTHNSGSSSLAAYGRGAPSWQSNFEAIQEKENSRREACLSADDGCGASGPGSGWSAFWRSSIGERLGRTLGATRFMRLICDLVPGEVSASWPWHDAVVPAGSLGGFVPRGLCATAEPACGGLEIADDGRALLPLEGRPIQALARVRYTRTSEHAFRAKRAGRGLAAHPRRSADMAARRASWFRISLFQGRSERRDICGQ